MANRKATGKKAKYGHEMVQRVRAAILGAFDATEKEGRLLSQILADELKGNPLKFLELASKYCPKEIDIEARILSVVDMTEEELEHIASGSGDGAAEETESQADASSVH